ETSKQQTVWMSHGDKVIRVPDGFQTDATSPSTPIGAMSNPDLKQYGVQFHPEVRHTENGNHVLKQFVFGACGCAGDWSIANFIEQETAKIKEKVGDRNVLCAMS